LANSASLQAELDGAETAIYMALRNLVPVLDADVALLVKALTIASSADKYKYTEESYAALKAEMTKGTYMLQKNCTKLEMDAQATLVMEAFDRLVLTKLDLRHLLQAIAKAERLKKDIYYVTEWNQMQKVLKTAYEIINDSETIQSEIDTVWHELLDAIAALRQKPDKEATISSSHVNQTPNDSNVIYIPTETAGKKTGGRVIFPGTPDYEVAIMLAICLMLIVICFLHMYKICLLRIAQKEHRLVPIKANLINEEYNS